MDSIETKIANECHIKTKWRIKEEVLKDVLNDLNDDNRFMESERLKAPKILGVEYYLLLKIHKEGPKEIYLYLVLESEMAREIDATVDLCIKSASYKLDIKETYRNSDVIGEYLCKRDELFDAEQKFFVNGIMEIELEGTLKPQGIIRKAPSLADVLWDNEEDEDLTIALNEDKDLTIAVNGQELKIHKWILCAKSPVFTAEMESGMKEARENRIEIPDFSFETVQIVVEYCYEQEIDDLINEENALELLHIADKYDMNLLHHKVQFALIDKISESNVVQLSNAAVTSNAKELREYCVCFLINAAGNSTLIESAKNLREEIASEIGRRSLFSVVE
uniref:BTB domain-containing protein n=1 Tax=Panagrolaimus davidi TaxID=227884 RepID=A0A914P2B9_9BILA